MSQSAGSFPDVAGSIRQRSDGVWRLRVFVGRDPVSGAPIQVHKTFRGTEAAAKKALARLVTQVEDGKFDGTTITVGELLDRWLDHIGDERTPSTIAGYKSKINFRIRPAIGKVKISKLSPAELDAWYAQWRKELSPASVRQIHAILRAALNQAVKWGWLDKNPVHRATAPKISSSAMSVPSPAELTALIATAEKKDPMLAAAIALAALTGCRRGELCALRWSDVALRRRTLTIQRSVALVNGELHIGDTKTHQARTIALDNLAVRVLIARWRTVVSLSELAGTPLVADPYILSRRGDGAEPCKPDGISHAFRSLTKDMGMTYHLHELRHFAATTAIGAGADIRTVAGRLGHADPSVTLRVYAHTLEAQDRAAAAAIGRAITPRALPSKSS